MSTLVISLFHKLSIIHKGSAIAGLDARRLQELLCYLLVYRHQAHCRETLASRLWDNMSTAQSKKQLRQTLWQLQTALDAVTNTNDEPLLLVEPEWITVNPQAPLVLDLAQFDQGFQAVQTLRGQELTAAQAAQLQAVVNLYQGDLLEGWYYDWCIFERERYQSIYLGLLDKLMDYCEGEQRYSEGIIYGTQILHYDRAREHTHRRLMRLHFLAGNRTAALRQYHTCVTALHEELDVGPAQRTVELYNQVKDDQLAPLSSLAEEQDDADGEERVDTRSLPTPAAPAQRAANPHVPLAHLREIQQTLDELRNQVACCVAAMETLTHSR
jgi:DNA-binding SARP family transcriptional activator